MVSTEKQLVKKPESGTPYQLEPSQTLKATSALLNKIQKDESEKIANADKTNLLADDDDEGDEATPIWLIMTTKKHIVDQKRLKPGKIVLPHPYHSASSPNLRICLITADPQRLYKDLVAHPSFPTELSSRIARVIGMEKLKAKYKSYESRRQLFGEYDIFLADDRIITYLPSVLGKVFYAGGSKRPVPVTLQGRREDSRDENGAKRLKLSEGGKKAVKSAPNPTAIAKDIERAISSALVHLSPSTNTAVKVGKANMEAEQLAENVQAVVTGMVDKFVTKGWRNVRGVHIKGPNTASLPIWLAEELWEDEADVLEKAPEMYQAGEGKRKKKEKKRELLAQKAADSPSKDEAAGKKRKASGDDLAESAARKEALARQKKEARLAVQAAA